MINFANKMPELSTDASAGREYRFIEANGKQMKTFNIMSSINIWLIIIHTGLKFSFITLLAKKAFEDLVFFFTFFSIVS